MSNDDENDAVELGHEPIALSARAVAKGFLVLFGVVAASLLLTAGLMMLFSKVAGGVATVNAPAQSDAVPSGVPTLDSDQSRSLRALRSRERTVLTEYAWLDAEAGIARIPIKRAMEIWSQSATTPAETRNNAPDTP